MNYNKCKWHWTRFFFFISDMLSELRVTHAQCGWFDIYDSLLVRNTPCMKSVQIRSFLCSVFSCIRTEYRKIRNRKTPYLDTFHAVTHMFWFLFFNCSILIGYSFKRGLIRGLKDISSFETFLRLTSGVVKNHLNHLN